jgi:preprotein translocase subunit SecG
MYPFLVVLHVLACLALILIVLLQTGKGADMGAAFGGASQTLFGGSGGSTFLSKLTTGAAVVFMITCLSLTYLTGGTPAKSLMENAPQEEPATPAPALPEAKPVQPAQPAQPQSAPQGGAGQQTAPAQQ